MNMIEDYAGNMIAEENAVRLVGDGERWADINDPDIVEVVTIGSPYSHALREETAYDERLGGEAHISTVRYVEFNDAYTSGCAVYLRCGTEYIPSMEDHVYVSGRGHCHPDEVSSCASCGDNYLLEDLDGDGCCGCCGESYKGDSEYIQEYHDHELGDTVRVLHHPDEGSKPHWRDHTIGFEVEKNSYGYCSGDYVGTYNLFAYWETDGSCGIEGITHAYTLGSSRLFSSHVREAEEMLSKPADTRCGGHLSVKGPAMVLEDIRRYAGLFYALYRHRLNNTYCNENLRLNPSSYARYAAIHRRDYGFYEFRLPRAVKNATQLERRFEFMRLWTDAIHEGMTFKQYLRSNRNLMRRIYPNNPAKRREIWALAHHFQRWIMGEEAHESIRCWLPARELV